MTRQELINRSETLIRRILGEHIPSQARIQAIKTSLGRR